MVPILTAVQMVQNFDFLTEKSRQHSEWQNRFLYHIFIIYVFYLGWVYFPEDFQDIRVYFPEVFREIVAYLLEVVKMAMLQKTHMHQPPHGWCRWVQGFGTAFTAAFTDTLQVNC